MAREKRVMTQVPQAVEANPYEMFKTQVRLAGEKLGLSQDLLEIIETPERVLEVSIPVRMDDGHIKVFQGLPRSALPRPRALQGWDPLPPSGDRGRGQGPGRLDDPQMRGGGHPLRRRQRRDRLRAHEALRRRTEAATAIILPLIGSNRDIPAPDVNTNAKIMNWFMETATACGGEPMYAIVTRKDVAVGGAQGRREATGREVMIITQEVLARLGKKLEGTTVAV